LQTIERRVGEKRVSSQTKPAIPYYSKMIWDVDLVVGAGFYKPGSVRVWLLQFNHSIELVLESDY